MGKLYFLTALISAAISLKISPGHKNVCPYLFVDLHRRPTCFHNTDFVLRDVDGEGYIQ